jgi:hypothetical protein
MGLTIASRVHVRVHVRVRVRVSVRGCACAWLRCARGVRWVRVARDRDAARRACVRIYL